MQAYLLRKWSYISRIFSLDRYPPDRYQYADMRSSPVYFSSPFDATHTVIYSGEMGSGHNARDATK